VLVTYPISTASLADAITLAKSMAKANGYPVTFLVKVNKVGNGSWEIVLRLGTK